MLHTQAPVLDLSSLSKLQGLTSLTLTSMSMAAPDVKFTGAAISAATAGMKQLAKLLVRGEISAWGSEHKLPGVYTHSCMRFMYVMMNLDMHCSRSSFAAGTS